jgi:prepilin peptidase CpaA
MRFADGYLVFSDAWFVELRFLLLGGFLIVAAVGDVRRRRIPNALVAAGLVAAFSYHLIDPIVLGWPRALAGMALGLALLLPFYLLRGMAAGDVKLMAMVGAFLGPQATLAAVLITFLVGGVWALLMVFTRGSWTQLVVSMKGLHPAGPAPAVVGTPSAALRKSTIYLPYGVAIGVGTMLSLFMSAKGMLPF